MFYSSWPNHRRITPPDQRAIDELYDLGGALVVTRRSEVRDVAGAGARSPLRDDEREGERHSAEHNK